MHVCIYIYIYIYICIFIYTYIYIDKYLFAANKLFEYIHHHAVRNFYTKECSSAHNQPRGILS